MIFHVANCKCQRSAIARNNFQFAVEVIKRNIRLGDACDSIILFAQVYVRVRVESEFTSGKVEGEFVTSVLFGWLVFQLDL